MPLDSPDYPDGEPRPIRHVDRYRNYMYGFTLAVDVLERGAKDKAYNPKPDPQPRPRRREKFTPSPSGLLVPTGTG